MKKNSSPQKAVIRLQPDPKVALQTQPIALLVIAALVLFALSAKATLTGQWDFNNGDLSATAGTALDYRGDTATYTVFTNATIGSSTNALVMEFPATTQPQGYIMYPGAAANGGGTKINRYTMIFDIMFPAASSGHWRTFLQTDTSNTSDGEFFVNPGNGIGNGTYSGTILADTWHRVAFVVDLTLGSGQLRKFIDGTLVGTQNLTEGIDGRYAVDPAAALLFADNDGDTQLGYVNSIQFHDVPLSDDYIAGLGAPSAEGIPVIQQWDFDSADLSPTAGSSALAYYDGPGGATDTNTVFGSTTALGISDIGGNVAQVMQFPACVSTMGYQVTNELPPNGGGFNVNQFTMIFDIMWPSAANGKWRTFFQTDDNLTPGGSTYDAEFFVNTANGIGVNGSYQGTISPDTWYRVALTVDNTLPSNKMKKYINGTLVGQQSLEGIDGRMSLPSTWLLLTDNDSDQQSGYVNSIQVQNRVLSGGAIASLGGPSADGIPLAVPSALSVAVDTTNQTDVVGMASIECTATAAGLEPFSYQWYKDSVAVSGQTNAELRFDWNNGYVQLSDAGEYTVVVTNLQQGAVTSAPVTLTVTAPPPAYITGQWDFNNSNLVASCGQDLEYYDAYAESLTAFGTTADLGVTNIAGEDATVLYGTQFADSLYGGFRAYHGIAPNGGGARVNQYTIIYDLLWTTADSFAYRSFFQTDTNNSTDGDAFVNGGNDIGIDGRYKGKVTPDEWHRVVLTYDLTKREFGKYIDGTNALTSPTGIVPYGSHICDYLRTSDGGVDGRWSLGPTILLFGDNDGDNAPTYVSSIQIRNGRMSDEAIALMGAPTAGKIPGCMHVHEAGGVVTIEWTGSVLETATDINGPWSAVGGAGHPYVVPTPVGAQFFRSYQ